MYGLVAKALASLTVDRVGEQRWHELCSGLAVDDTFRGMRAAELRRLGCRLGQGFHLGRPEAVS